MSSFSKFTNALDTYVILLSSIAGVIYADYYIVRRGYLKLIHLFLSHEDGYYMYNYKFGIN